MLYKVQHFLKKLTSCKSLVISFFFFFFFKQVNAVVSFRSLGSVIPLTVDLVWDLSSQVNYNYTIIYYYAAGVRILSNNSTYVHSPPR